MDKPLRLFVSPAWRRAALQHSALLFPFWGVPEAEKKPFFRALFGTYHLDTGAYTITDTADADMVFLPYDFKTAQKHAPELIELAQQEAARQGKLLLVDALGDIEIPVALPRTVVLRWGGYRFLKKETDVTLPFFADDLLERYCGGVPVLRKKSEVPSVAFAGWANLPPAQRVRTILKELPTRARGVFDSRWQAARKGIFFRQEAIQTLRNSSLVEAHILERNSYSAHTDTASNTPHVLQREMVDNLLGSDYGLDVRGDANNSIRLFEILSLGRIPVILDTERNFPFADEVDYASFSFTVDFRDRAQLPQLLRAFHDSLSEESFAQMQRNARDAYVRYFRIDALMPHVVHALRSYI